MDRHSLRFAGDIPQGNIDTGERVADWAVAPHGVELALQVRHERWHIGKFATDAQRLDNMQNRLTCQR